MSYNFIKGAQRHADRLKKLSEKSDRISKLVFVGADMIKTEARHSITAGAISGKGHIPSRPGEPPNRDTGYLDTNIEAFRTGPFTAETRSQGRYAAFLEYGTSRMQQRPYMRPAVKVVLPKFHGMLNAEVKAMVRES